MILLSGGTESPTNALSVAAFYLSDDKSIASRLRAEVEPVMRYREKPISLTELEKLPYLVSELFCTSAVCSNEVSDRRDGRPV